MRVMVEKCNILNCRHHGRGRKCLKYRKHPIDADCYEPIIPEEEIECEPIKKEEPIEEIKMKLTKCDNISCGFYSTRQKSNCELLTNCYEDSKDCPFQKTTKEVARAEEEARFAEIWRGDEK